MPLLRLEDTVVTFQVPCLLVLAKVLLPSVQQVPVERVSAVTQDLQTEISLTFLHGLPEPALGSA